MTDREPPEQERTDGEGAPEGDAAGEPRDWRRSHVDTSHLDATLEGLPDDPAPPMPHLRPISGMATERDDDPPSFRIEHAPLLSPEPEEAEEQLAEEAVAEPSERPTAEEEQQPSLPWSSSPPAGDDEQEPDGDPAFDAVAETNAAEVEPPGVETTEGEAPEGEAIEPGPEAEPGREPGREPEAAGPPSPAHRVEVIEETPSGGGAWRGPVIVRTRDAEPEPAAVALEAPSTAERAGAVAAPVVAEAPPTPRRTPGVPLNGHAVVLIGLATAVFLAFVLIEPPPRWMLLVGAGVVVFGLDGVLRATWREPFAAGETTTPYLFLPALFMLGAPVIVQHNIPAPWVILAGIGIGVGFGAIVVAELISVRPGAPEYPAARVIATAGAYFTLFALASMTYVFEASLLWSLVVMAMLGIMLGIEVLREGEIDPMETLVFSLVVGFVLLQARWVLHYLPLESYMAGLTLTLVFFFTTGLLHAHITRRFDAGVVVEYTGIAAAGLALVVVATVTGLG